MCGRFTLASAAEIVAEFFGLTDVPELPPRYNIAPTQPVAAVVAVGSSQGDKAGAAHSRPLADDGPREAPASGPRADLPESPSAAPNLRLGKGGGAGAACGADDTAAEPSHRDPPQSPSAAADLRLGKGGGAGGTPAAVGDTGARGASGSGARRLRMFHWGLILPGSAEPVMGARMINARSETAAQKPAFRQAFRRRRCVVPADGFYEWKKLGRARQPYYIRMADDRPFGIAGLWERWEGTDGTIIESCTLLTGEPNELVATLHDRMPIILPRADFGLWLDLDVHDPARLAPLLRPYPAGDMRAFAVSKRVNSPGNDDAACARPLDEGAPSESDGYLFPQ